MTARAATREDFDEILATKDRTFYSWEFIEDISNALNTENISLSLEDENGKYILPLIKKKVFGPYSIALSVPFGLYGGILALNSLDEKRYAALMNEARRHLKTGIVFQNLFDETLLAKAKFSKIKATFSHLAPLEGRAYGEYSEAEFSHGMKEGVKKALKNNVRIVAGNSTELMEDFYKLYQSSNMKWGKKTPRYEIDFFKNFLNKEYVEIRIAYYLGQPAGGLFMLKFKRYYFDWFAGMKMELRNSRANDYLHAHLISEGIGGNFSVINFGASDALPGVQKFKESFGAKKTEYCIYFCGNPAAKAVLQLMMVLFF